VIAVSEEPTRLGPVSTALYRRYRPESFADVIGQEHVTEPLMQALRTGRVSHAYLFSGPRGCGKTTSARILARCLNCEQGPTPIPCGVCDSCVALARAGSGSVDVIEIDAASHGGVDDARDLRERAAYGPAQSRYKIYIIDEAHMVTPQGFNALLKIVEEPPEHVKFIFATTEPDKVIGTIRSRTHHYPFRLVPPLRLQDYLGKLCALEKVAVAPGVLSFVVRAGGGSVRDSLSVLDQLIAGSGDEGLTYAGAAALLGFTEGELLDATVDGLTAGDGGAVFRQIDKVIETGHDPRRFVEDLLERLRDLIVVAAVPDGASSVLRGVPEDQLERMRQQSAAFGPGALSRAANILNTGLSEMTGATPPRLQLELICARVLLPGASGESGYAARLDRLERRLEMSGMTAPVGHRSVDAPTSEPAGHHEPDGTEAPPPPPDRAGHIAERDRSAGPYHDDRADGATAQREDHQPGRSTASPTAQGRAQEHVRGGVADPHRASPSDIAPRPSPVPGGIDTAAIRRSWPDVLAKIFTIRRTTWTFLSEHTQVLDYDGRRLLLGIQTEGLANTFRRGQHAELVCQALSEVLGVDAVVEGIPSKESTQAASSQAAPAASAPDLSGPTAHSLPVASPSGSAASAGTPAPQTESHATARSQSQPPSAGTLEPQTESGRSEPLSAGASGGRPGSVGPPKSQPRSSAASATRSAAPPAAPGHSTPMQRARALVAHETIARPSVADDSVVSPDDEDIEEVGAVGQPVIESVLGGTVIGEIDQ
jgi:DNA polymerase-3 subunit gamma/tau